MENGDAIDCIFEHFRAGIVMKDQFSIPVKEGVFNISAAWQMIKFCFDRIEKIDPTTRVLSLKLIQKKIKRTILKYQVGAQVKH